MQGSDKIKRLHVHFYFFFKSYFKETNKNDKREKTVFPFFPRNRCVDVQRALQPPVKSYHVITSSTVTC